VITEASAILDREGGKLVQSGTLAPAVEGRSLKATD
jgi:hypothetical protein